MFEHLTKALLTDEESKPLVVLDVSKCDNGWCLFLASNDFSNLLFAYK